MKFSRFTHIFRLKRNVFVFYNSLVIKPIYFSKKEYLTIMKTQKKGFCDLDNNILPSLIDLKIIVSDDKEDDDLLNQARSKFLHPYPVIAYFIVSEQCNLACKYCFVGNDRIDNIKHQLPFMTKETAKQALEYYSFQLKTHPEWFEEEKEIIFYGGEPLLNYEVLKYVILEAEDMINHKQLPQKLHFSMVSNGILLDKEKITFLKEHNVNCSISIDGFDYKSNKNRVDKEGKSIYDKILLSLDIVKQCQWDIGLSVTLNKETIKSVKKILQLLDKYHIKKLCFNLLHYTNSCHINQSYYKKETSFIINFFKAARKLGIYEERINRKITSFVQNEIYLSDCAATSGSQIVIFPNGKVGVCHGCMESKDYVFSDIDSFESIEQFDIVRKWSKISPITKDYCLSCEALGICGGGCPVNGIKNSIEDVSLVIDKNFCIHAKQILFFMINDMYAILKTGHPLD